jgi:2-keto-4-pentenoate hydratase/2-oxohepta-3-ene-1,7-dioic acid hydratase in catechol pathway
MASIERAFHMAQDRRDFLKTAGLVAAAVTLPASSRAADPSPPKSENKMSAKLTYATLSTPAGLTLGVRTDRGILDVARAERIYQCGAPATITEVIERPEKQSALTLLVEKARAGTDASVFVAENSAKFGPCVTHPEKIICIGLNYRAHIEEANAKLPPVPILFNKFNSSLNSHGGKIDVSKEKCVGFDYEAELVLVIGKTARDVTEEAALDHVFGYCVGNDFTARDMQFVTGQWMVGKAGDGWGPIGPWLVSANQIDPNNLKIECKVNGEVRQSANTSKMIFDCRKLVSYISKYMTLKPGDLIFTGTPEGVIIGLPKEKQVWLKAGDRITTSIEHLGELDFTLT